MAVASSLVGAWLAGRSLARGLPAPLAERGGFRVDTGAEDEVRRYVFGMRNAGLIVLGREIRGPRQPIKLCAPIDELLEALPPGWEPQPGAYFMRGGEPRRRRALPPG